MKKNCLEKYSLQIKNFVHVMLVRLWEVKKKQKQKNMKCRHNNTPLPALGLPSDLVGSVTIAEIEMMIVIISDNSNNNSSFIMV